VPFTTEYDQNILTPVAAGDRLIFGGIKKPTFALRVRKNGANWTTEKVWETREVTMYMSTPVASGNRLYGLSERRQGQMFCLDAANGKVLWTGEARFGENAAVFDGGSVLLALNPDADLWVFRKNGDALTVLTRYEVANSPTWASPAFAGRSILIKDASTLALWEVRPGP